MPLVKDKSTAPPKPAPTTVRIAAPEYRGVTVDTRSIPSTHLLTHIEGSSWTVNYYSQILNDDSALAGQNVTQNPIYQQYKLITGFELKVTAPLAPSQDPESLAMLTTGTANVYPSIIPNVGDMFLADVGDGREGVFRVTHSERKQIYKDSTYTIEYVLVDYSTVERRADLNSKVVETVFFVRDFIKHGQNPLLHTDEYVAMQKLQANLEDMTARYFREFTSTEYRTLLVPGQTQSTYDHFLTKAVTSFFTTYDAPEIRNIRKLNVDDDLTMKAVQIWDVLAERNIKMLKHCSRTFGLVSARTFQPDPMLDGIRYSGIRNVVYLTDPDLNVDIPSTYLPKVLSTDVLVDTPSRVRQLSDLIADNQFEGLTRPDVVPIHKVTLDNFYVLSSYFYSNSQTGQSQLEICVRDYLDEKAPNIPALLAFCKVCNSWGALERFYYVPILMVLIKSAIRGI